MSEEFGDLAGEPVAFFGRERTAPGVLDGEGEGGPGGEGEGDGEVEFGVYLSWRD